MANNLTLVQQKLSERLRVSAVSADFDAEKYEARGKKEYIFLRIRRESEEKSHKQKDQQNPLKIHVVKKKQNLLTILFDFSVSWSGGAQGI